jgi:hypothetical protein
LHAQGMLGSNLIIDGDKEIVRIMEELSFNHTIH